MLCNVNKMHEWTNTVTGLAYHSIVNAAVTLYVQQVVCLDVSVCPSQ